MKKQNNWILLLPLTISILAIILILSPLGYAQEKPYKFKKDSKCIIFENDNIVVLKLSIMSIHEKTVDNCMSTIEYYMILGYEHFTEIKGEYIVMYSPDNIQKERLEYGQDLKEKDNKPKKTRDKMHNI